MNTMPLSNREYYALLELFGIENSFRRCSGELNKRAQMVPDGVDRMRLILKLADGLIQDFVGTIPPNKLIAIRKELENVVCEVKVRYDFAKTDNREFVYIPAEAVDRLANRVINMECLVCDKNAKQAKKCKVFQDLGDCYPWEIKPKDEACCPWAGYFITD